MKCLAVTMGDQPGQIHALESVSSDVCVFDFVKHAHEIQQNGNRTDVDHLLLHKVKIFKPDWIWAQLHDSKILSPHTFFQIKKMLPDCVIVTWNGDCREELAEQSRQFCRVVDVVLASAAGNLKWYVGAGAKHVGYLQIGLDWKEDIDHEPAWEPPFRVPEVVFCGRYYQHFPGVTMRAQVVGALLRAGIDAGVVGDGWKNVGIKPLGNCTTKQQAQVYKRAKVVLSINNFNEVDRYYSDRQLIGMASGKPVVCYAIPGIELEFTDGVHCLFFKTVDEAVRKVQLLLRNPGYAERVGAAGRRVVMQEHSWLRRMLDVVGHVDYLKRQWAAERRVVVPVVEAPVQAARA